jgi:hypothetical protein
MPQDNERVKKWSVGWLAVPSLLFMFASSGCSDTADGDPAAALASCNKFCEAYLAANCADYPTLDDCKSIECSDLPRDPVGCQNQIRLYYDCRQGQANICINPDDATDECWAEWDDLLMCSA